jgi:Family of unknown function (DUF5989)
MSKLTTLREIGRFLMTRKRYWLVPIVLVFLIFGALLVMAESSAVAPFVYTLF